MATYVSHTPKRPQSHVRCDTCDTREPGKHYCTICRKTMCNNCQTIHAKLIQYHKVVARGKISSSDNLMPEDYSEYESVKREIDNVKLELDEVRANMEQELEQSMKQNLERSNDIRKEIEGLKGVGKYVILLLIILLCFIAYLQLQGSYIKPVMTEDLSVVIEELSQIFFQQVDNLKLYLWGKALNLRRPSLKISTPAILASFRAETQGYPSICTTSDGHTWIGGYESRELILVDINGKIYKRRKVKHRTYHLALTSSGYIIIKRRFDDSSLIVRLGRDGTEKKIYDSPSSACNGVSVARDGRILVSKRSGILLTCNTDGSNAKNIYKNDKPGGLIHAIELLDKTICISDWSNKRLVVIDKNGKQITTIKKPMGRKNYRPFGLACDRMGNILSADWYNDCVYIIDQKRHVKELVGSSHGIKKPRWIDLDKDDNLWIAQDSGTITVVKYITPIV